MNFPSRREAVIHTHFPPPGIYSMRSTVPLASRSSASSSKNFFYISSAWRSTAKRNARRTPSPSHVREDRVREALKRILPFKPTAAQKRVLAEIAADLEKPTPMNRLLQGDVGSGKTIVALQAAVIAIENGCQAALMAPTEILAVQHFLSARRILATAGYHVELLISGLKPRRKVRRARTHRQRRSTAGRWHSRAHRR